MDQQTSNDSSQIGPLVTVLKEPWPYQGNRTSFLQNALNLGDGGEDEKETENEQYLCVLGGSNSGEAGFKQLTCACNSISNTPNDAQIQLKDFRLNKHGKKKCKNADLSQLKRVSSARYIKSFLIKRTVKGTELEWFIITLAHNNGYSCYSCDRDTWICLDNSSIKPETDLFQALLLMNQS